MQKLQTVYFETCPGADGDLGVISLNRPDALNALDYSMIQDLSRQLTYWANDASIKAVVIKSTPGRAFCAGGDIRKTYEYIQNKDETALRFFHDEYALNRLIYHYPKPYIALLDGITMGGGVGISIHGSHRVATHKLSFAMPETGIGFFPDVGGTHFLPRLPHRVGYYMGLTGARINCDDALALGIVQHKVNIECFDELIEKLAHTSFSSSAKQSVTNILDEFSNSPEPSRLMEHIECIEQIFNQASVEEMMMAMDARGSHFAIKARSMLMTKSPTSLKVTFSALQKGSQLDFDACMQQEYCLVSHFLKGHDFAEGVRAVVIDKDKAPEWQPKMLGEVDEMTIVSYFEPENPDNRLKFIS